MALQNVFGDISLEATQTEIKDILTEVVGAIQALRMQTEAITRTVGLVMPDTAGRMRVLVDAITGSLTLATITTVSTVSTVSNQTSVGGYNANEQLPALMRLGADCLRRNISVT